MPPLARKSGFGLRKAACAWLPNALISLPAMLPTTANPTDGRFDGDASGVVEEGVHPEGLIAAS
jgi:hypothetical protein